MDEDARKRFLGMRMKADLAAEKQADRKQMERFKSYLEKTARTQVAVSRATNEVVINSLYEGRKLIPEIELRNRPGEKLAMGKTKGPKRKKASGRGMSL